MTTRSPDKLALITAAASGIGRATAAHVICFLASSHADVTIDVTGGV